MKVTARIEVTSEKKRNKKIDDLFATMLGFEPVQPLAKNMFMAKSEFERTHSGK